jgi:O-methyltransferase domain
MILKNQADAMRPGYSKLLICDVVLPDTNCSEHGTGLDIGMMILHSGMERSESQWSQLLQQAGLKLVKIWRPSSADYSAIVEAVRAGIADT